MGASTFCDVGTGSSPKEAFLSLVEDARNEFGNEGYTGTIAEKHEFKIASSNLFKSYDEASAFAESKCDDSNHWSSDKWGPAAYVTFLDGSEVKYLFFGWASD